MRIWYAADTMTQSLLMDLEQLINGLHGDENFMRRLKLLLRTLQQELSNLESRIDFLERREKRNEGH